MAFLRLTEFCHKQDGRSQKSLGRIIKVSVLSEACRIHAGKNNGLGDNLCILLGLRLIYKYIGIRLMQIHILVDQMKEIVAVGTGRVTQVNY